MSMVMVHITGIGMAYGLQLVLTRWMGATSYGAYIYVYSWATTAALITRLGLPEAMIRFIPAYRANNDTAHLRGLMRWSHRMVVRTSFVFALLASTVIMVLARTDGLEHVGIWILGAWFVPVLSLVKLRSESLRAAQRYIWTYVPVLILRPLLMLSGTAILIYAGFNLTGTWVMIFVVGAFAVVLLIQTIVTRKTFLPATSEPRPQYDHRQWLDVALPLLLVALFILSVNQADILMLGFLADTRAVGLYRVATRVATLVSFPLAMFNIVLAPTISSTFARAGSSDLQRIVRSASRRIFWASLLLSLLVFFFADPLLRLFGPEFPEALWGLRALAAAHFVNACTGPVAHLLNFTGHQRESARVYGFAALINLMLNIIGIPYFGILGAALALALTFVIRNVWLYVLVVRKLGVHAFFLAGRTSSTGHDGAAP